MSNPLRPVGTEFWHECPHPVTSTSSHKRRTLYRVAKHLAGADGRLQECVTPVRHQLAECVGINAEGEHEYGGWEDES